MLGKDPHRTDRHKSLQKHGLLASGIGSDRTRQARLRRAAQVLRVCSVMLSTLDRPGFV
jgi:hypothetical protein